MVSPGTWQLKKVYGYDTMQWIFLFDLYFHRHRQEQPAFYHYIKVRNVFEMTDPTPTAPRP